MGKLKYQTCCRPFGSRLHRYRPFGFRKITTNTIQQFATCRPDLIPAEGETMCFYCIKHLNDLVESTKKNALQNVENVRILIDRGSTLDEIVLESRTPSPNRLKLAVEELQAANTVKHMETEEAKMRAKDDGENLRIRVTRGLILDEIMLGLRSRSPHNLREAIIELEAAKTEDEASNPSSQPSTPSQLESDLEVFETPRSATKMKESRLQGIFKTLGKSPFNSRRSRSRAYVTTKIVQGQNALCKSILELSQVNVTPERALAEKCARCKDLLNDLVVKFKDSQSKLDKYRILTTVPTNLTLEQVKHTFGCTMYMARVASSVRSKSGIMSVPIHRKEGHYKVNDDLRKKIVDFYLHPDNGRICPGLRSTVLVMDKEVGKRVRVAKHQMFVTQREFYEDLKKAHPDVANVSLTTVALLRPRQCQWGGHTGFLNSCVSVVHQNFELLLNAVHITLKTSEFMKTVLCAPPLEKCYLGLCLKCPKVSAIKVIAGISEEEVDLPSSSIYTGPPTSEEEQLRVLDLGAPNLEEEVDYHIWVNNELRLQRDTPSHICETIEHQLAKVGTHHFMLRKQQEFFKKLENDLLTEDAASIHLDFGENYSFVVQDAIQAFHWTNSQMSVHPFFCQWSDDKENIKSESFIVLSDIREHGASTIEAFRRTFVPIFKEKHPNIKKLYYVSDGTGAQYKNYKNFVNIMFHKKQYDLQAECHFTVSYHGKSQCDAMSAVVKRTLRLASLRDRVKILTAKDAYDYCVANLSKHGDKETRMNFIYIEVESVSNLEEELDARYATVTTIPGTQSYHSFIPISDFQILTRRYSLCADSKIFNFIPQSEPQLMVESYATPNIPDITVSLKLGWYVAVKILNSFRVGLIERISVEEREIEVITMRRSGKGNSFQWPDRECRFVVPSDDVIRVITVPSTQTGRIYKLIREEYDLLNIAS